MLNLLNDNIDNGLIFIYGLIGVVIILIIIISIIDRIDNKKRKQKKSLADTLSMKPIKVDEFENKDLEILNSISKQESKPIMDVDTVPVPDKKIDYEVKIPDIKKIEDIRIVTPVVEKEEVKEEIEEDYYVEDDLEKTQAQIRVEEITKALEEAQVDEKIEQDKYAKFEEEQEKNAFISYEELKNNYDRLYQENEKTQYVDDSTIPINIKELYDAAKQEELKTSDVETLTMDSVEELTEADNMFEVRRSNVDNDINNANSFLNNLKELRDNLD